MENFKWIEEPSGEEREALRKYKDFAWEPINQQLRAGDLASDSERATRLLDSVILKGRTTRPVTLYRALEARFIPQEIGEVFCDKGFMSTTVSEKAAIEFYPAAPAAKLVIELPAGASMAAFEHDAAGGEERERLLPRETRLEVTAVEQIHDLERICREQCTSGKHWLSASSTLIKVWLRLLG